MQLKSLFKEFDSLQLLYGDKNFDSIYGCGCIDKPDICFVFMNPTAKNVSASKDWKGLKAPWLGTKNIWKMFYSLGIIEKDIFDEIDRKKQVDWDYDFSIRLYKYLESKKFYITNLAKCTQKYASHLNNSVFKAYLPIFHKEINLIKPKIIITFGGQVSSIILGENIKVSENRKIFKKLEIGKNLYKIFPVYYPVGQGMRNIKVAKEDINWIMENN